MRTQFENRKVSHPFLQTVLYAKHSFVETTVRFPYGYADQPSRLLEEIINFRKTVGSCTIEVVTTANVAFTNSGRLNVAGINALPTFDIFVFAHR